MLSIRTVLCPVNFSPSTPRQIELAIDVCRAFGAQLVLHHNMVELAIGAGVGWMWAAGHPNQQETETMAESRLQEAVAAVPQEMTVERRLTHGPLVRAVLSVADAVNADLIVMSTRGAAGGDDEDGSTTERLLEHPRRAILAMHEATSEHRTPKFGPGIAERQPLLVPTDLTPKSQPAVDAAVDLARRCGFDLHLLYVPPRGSRTPADQVRAQLTAAAPADLPRRPDVHVEAGNTALVIARVAEDIGASCIVMGEHAHTPLRHWFRPDTPRGVLHRAPCPIWYVPTPSEGQA